MTMTRVAQTTSAARAFGVATAILVLAPAPPSCDAADTWHDRVRMSVALRTTQDDNFLQYSDGQIATFEAGTNPDRYSIESVDDLVFQPSAALTYEKDCGPAGGRTIRIRWTGEFHRRNGTADHGAMGFSWREEFANARSISLGVNRLPNYYLRQLFDEDVPSGIGVSRYRRASFALTTGSAEYQQQLAAGTTGRLYYQYERREYNSDFRERDSDTHEGGLAGGWNPRLSRFDLSASAGYRTSLAAAKDGDEAAGAPTDDPDVSYHGVVLTGESRARLARPAKGRLDADIGYQFRTRTYTTDRATDSSHFERKDLISDLLLGLRWNLRGPLSVRAFYAHENDHASFSSANPPATDPASYSADQFGASVEWGSTLWKR